MKSCCTTKRKGTLTPLEKTNTQRGQDTCEQVLIPGGSYSVGTNSNEGYADDFEGPQIQVSTNDFYIDATPVTNRDFALFCEATCYQTTAERLGTSFVFHLLLDGSTPSIPVPGLPWWHDVQGASWKYPFGNRTSYLDLLDHPVVHVSIEDALHYCQWSQKRLPSELEWEIACRFGSEFDRYPWGESLMVENKHQCNIWQGSFPMENTQSDGYLGTAPVKSLYRSESGLWQMIGNVWELCANPARVPLQDIKKQTLSEQWESLNTQTIDVYAAKGGSFLCHASYCNRYRMAARNGIDRLSTSSNVGFRCVSNKEAKE